MENELKFNHEIGMAMAERTIARLWILSIILIVCLIGTNAAWIYYESQWEVTQTSQEITQDIDTGDGDLGNVIGIGDYYGEGKAEN